MVGSRLVIRDLLLRISQCPTLPHKAVRVYVQLCTGGVEWAASGVLLQVLANML